MLPQAKQLPQKEFVMMEVGKSGGPRKGSRNPPNKNNVSGNYPGSQNPSLVNSG